MKFKSEKQRRAVMAKLKGADWYRLKFPSVRAEKNFIKKWRKSDYDMMDNLVSKKRKIQYEEYRRSPARLYFNKKSDTERVYENDLRYKAETRWMTPEQFLKRTFLEYLENSRGSNSKILDFNEYVKVIKEDWKIKRLKEYLKEGNKLPKPDLEYNTKGDIVNHEGRHRALLMKEKGVEYIPVFIYRRKKWMISPDSKKRISLIKNRAWW